jgi:hypothetical protein
MMRSFIICTVHKILLCLSNGIGCLYICSVSGTAEQIQIVFNIGDLF